MCPLEDSNRGRESPPQERKPFKSRSERVSKKSEHNSNNDHLNDNESNNNKMNESIIGKHCCNRDLQQEAPSLPPPPPPPSQPHEVMCKGSVISHSTSSVISRLEPPYRDDIHLDVGPEMVIISDSIKTHGSFTSSSCSSDSDLGPEVTIVSDASDSECVQRSQSAYSQERGMCSSTNCSEIKEDSYFNKLKRGERSELVPFPRASLVRRRVSPRTSTSKYPLRRKVSVMEQDQSLRRNERGGSGRSECSHDNITMKFLGEVEDSLLKESVVVVDDLECVSPRDINIKWKFPFELRSEESRRRKLSHDRSKRGTSIVRRLERETLTVNRQRTECLEREPSKQRTNYLERETRIQCLERESSKQNTICLERETSKRKTRCLERDSMVRPKQQSAYCSQYTANRRKKIKVRMLRRRRKILIVGDMTSGKSNLISAYCKDQFRESYIPTILNCCHTDAQVCGERIDLVLIDISGRDDFEPLRKRGYRKIDAVILCYAVNNIVSFERVEKFWVPEIKKYAAPKTPFILVGTKRDLRDDARDRLEDFKLKLKKEDEMSGRLRAEVTFKDTFVSCERGRRMARATEAAGFYECSSLYRDSTREIFESVTKIAVRKTRRKKKYDNRDLDKMCTIL